MCSPWLREVSVFAWPWDTVCTSVPARDYVRECATGLRWVTVSFQMSPCRRPVTMAPCPCIVSTSCSHPTPPHPTLSGSQTCGRGSSDADTLGWAGRTPGPTHPDPVLRMGQGALPPHSPPPGRPRARERLRARDLGRGGRDGGIETREEEGKPRGQRKRNQGEGTSKTTADGEE